MDGHRRKVRRLLLRGGLQLLVVVGSFAICHVLQVFLLQFNLRCLRCLYLVHEVFHVYRRSIVTDATIILVYTLFLIRCHEV